MLCKCGFTLNDNVKFCPNCGEKVSAPATASTPAILCPNTIQDGRRVDSNCGARIEYSQKFCTECGWPVNTKVFLPGAVMCIGIKGNGEYCDNIVTPNIKFCSECGKPPGTTTVIKKTFVKDFANEEHGQQASSENTEQGDMDIDFEIVTISQNEREQSTQDNERTTLENSSDFCNGFPNTTRDLESSVDFNLQSSEEGKETGSACESMEIAEKPQDGNIDHQAEENITASQVNVEKTSDFQQRDPRVNEALTKVAMDKKGGNMKQLPNENITKPQDENKFSGDPQDRRNEFPAKVVEDGEVTDSGSLSTESTVYKPSFTMEFATNNSSEGNEENKMIEKIKALEVRKRKSPEREISDTDCGKKILLMSDISGKDEVRSDDSIRSDKTNLDEKVEDSGKVDESEQKENDDDEDDEEEEEDDDDDEHVENDGDGGISSKLRKKHRRKKTKYKYQKRKGQLPESLSKQGKSSGKTNQDKPNTDVVSNTIQADEPPNNSKDQPGNEDHLQRTRKPSSLNKNPETGGNDGANGTKDKESSNNTETKVQLLISKIENPLAKTDDEKKGDDQGKQNSKSSEDPKKSNEETKDKDHPTYTKASNRSGVNTRSSQCVEVHFHVIVTYECVRNANQDHVYLRFLQELGGWNALLDVNQLHPKESLRSVGVLFEGVIQVPKRIAHLNLYYNYCIVPNGAMQYAWNEYFHKEKKRTLKIPDKKDVWHRYDGVVLPSPSQEFVRMTVPVFGYEFFDTSGYEEHVAKILKYAVQTFFPYWKGYFTNSPKSSMNAEEAINTIDMIWIGFWTNYGNMMKRWNRQADKFRKELGQAFLELLRPILQEITHGNAKLPVSAIGILYLVEKFYLDVNSTEYTSLFKSLVFDGSKKEESLATYKEIMESFSSEFLKELLEGLIMRFCTSTNPMWLCCIPLWQFVTKKVTPFERVQLSAKHDQTRPVWWGIEDYDVDRAVSNLKKIKWSNIKEILTTLSPMFPMDYLLPRTLMAGLKYEQFNDVFEFCEMPPEITLAGTVYFIKLSREVENQKEVTKRCFENIIQQINKRHNGTENITEVDLHQAWITYHIASDFIDAVLKNASFLREICLNSFKIFALALSSYENMLQRRKLGEKERTQHRNADAPLQVLHKQRESIRRWMRSLPFYQETKSYLKAWNEVLSMEMKDGTVKTAFMADMRDAFKEDIDGRNRGLEKLVDIYCSDIGEFSLPMQEALSDAALEALQKGCELDDSILHGKGVERYGGLLSKLFEITWKKKVPEKKQSLLDFTLTWPNFRHFLDMFYLQEKRSKLLTRESGGLLMKAAEEVWKMYEELQNGQITVRNFHLLQKNYEYFIRIITIMAERDKGKSTFKQAVIQRLMKIREKEIVHFEKTLDRIGIFVDLCHHFTVNMATYDEALTSFRKLDSCRIAELCHPIAPEKVSDLDSYIPHICAFEVDDEILSVIPDLKRCSKGILFMKLWERKGKKCVLEDTSKKALDVGEVITNVWYPVYENLQAITKRIHDGVMLFSEFQRLFGEMRDDILIQELEHLSVDGDITWIEKRMEQIREHRTVQHCVKGASVIMNVVETYGLEGDFKQINLIVEMAKGKDIAMCKLNRDLIKATVSLKGMTEEQADCLAAFMECKPLVEWLRDSMKTLQELKVFVDLASISAGEGDMEVAKVKCLHAATTGYAPLIFNLNANCDSKMFLENCELVWKELASDPKLPQKLKDTNRQLEWLNSVKSAQGSVEVTSMKQAEAINSVGIYMVGKIDPNLHKEKPTVEDVLMLHVQEDTEGSRLRKKYKYKELQELQSKLMLVAGKAEMGRMDVERFTIIFDAVVRLCKVYIKLVSSGCVLFTNWQARFLCDPERKVCAFVKFGSGEGCTQLKGRRNEEEDVSTTIPRLAKFMEVCLEEWLKYIDQKRDEFHHLNFFTVDQMVILQRELVLMGGEVDPSDFIYPLLSIVKHDCTKMELIGALKKAKGDVTQREAEQEVEMAEQEEDEEIDTDDENQLQATAIAKFISAITDSGYPEKLAREALRKGIAPDDIDEGIVWCMEHEDQTEMEVEVDEEQTEGSVVEDYEGWTKSEASISTMTQDILSSLQYTRDNAAAADTLIPDLEQLWGEFLSSISSSVSDYLSVEHLGIILRRLSETETFTVSRPFLPCFEEGVPNLLLCPQDEILNTVLTIYSHDVDQPLPQSDEILMCTSHTTLDEVEIFWRRAVFDTTDRIHCLVNGDLLDYEVSDRGERRLEHHMQKAKENDIAYKLVVVCSIERENHSRIVAALDKYRRPPLPLMTHDNMEKYIKDKLTFNIKKPAATPAAEADFEHCTVRVVKSWRAGVGKTLHKKRLAEKLQGLHSGVIRRNKAVVSIPLHEREIDIDDIMTVLLENTLHPGKIEPRLFHIDLSHEVQEGVDYLLFQLLILGCLTNSTGHVWRKVPYDLYIVETMPLLARDFQEQRGYIKCMHRCLDILPDVTCRSPQESLKKYQGNAPDIGQNDLLFDNKEFKSNVFQRPFQYLYRLDMNRGLGDVDMRRTEGNPQTCLNTLLRHCGIRDPSWAELRHFVWFLNTQLVDFENSAFVSLAAAEDLPGFSQFVLRFLIQMSRDFATRSLDMSEESPIQMLQRMDIEEEEEEEEEENDEAVLRQFQMRRTWESSPHPYLFFNPDHHSMTFLGFNIERQSGNLIDVQTGRVLETGIMQRNLQDALTRNRVPINENFDSLPRDQKLIKLCSVMGLEDVFDPDPTYELTTDNVKKILAIYMRFRCDIPVIIMGETGCGKTRLIKFMCQLQCPIGVEVQNMILMKVHGGTRRCDIKKKVEEAERVAQENTANYGQRLYTVLFFDEANTTEAIGLIKEIMCDRSMEGEPLRLCQTLKIVAACNPYRKHSEDLIKRLEQAGLGYHVDADKTCDRMGRVPMRRLVYRVQPLPQSMLPLVWDFGQLDTDVEEMYIKQMVLRYIRGGKLPDNKPNLDTAVSHILTAAQEFMRRQQDECSFVSLRDVERVLEVMSWFYTQSQGGLFDLMDEEEETDSDEELEMEDMEEEAVPHHQTVSDLTKALVLALGVCYHACLKNRDEFREEMVRQFRPPVVLPKGADQMLNIITSCQNVFLEIENIGANIAKNQALRENVFMMVICIELRIPLFLVGKPGSSKSLAKTIVADAMQGNAAHTEIYRNYKQVQMVSFQCSPLSVPEGIMGTFRQCAMYQKDKDLNRFVSVVVLDEVGLAEDSPRMPLKTLHPLLEDGCQGDEKPEEHKKVAFIGISNWALDPAKMNRGILVQREVPDREELEESADGICSGNRRIKKMIKPLIKPLAESYLQVFDSVIAKREFFGLRDFYSLIKMVYSFAEKNNKKPTWLMLQHCIKRNFGGFKHSEDQDPLTVFSEKLKTVEKISKPSPGDPDCSPAGLIEACLKGDDVDSDTRYLLLLTENYGALSVLQQKILTMKNAITIFGSSFPSDQEYTQVCRNINRIKVCMETGNTVVLLNLENLYESLYDALNQYYVYFGGERYVDLGLGTHRVKCRVHKKFRLIVVAEKEIVYSKFPIPLINRLEKHFLNISTMLSAAQVRLAEKLEDWAQQFVKISLPIFRNPREKAAEYKIGDVFMGFHADTCASIILHVCQKYSDDDLETIENEVMQDAKEILLWCATPDGVLRAKKRLRDFDFDFVENIYYEQQKHDNLLFYLDQKIRMEHSDGLYAQVTTSSKLITTADIADLSQHLHIPRPQISLLTLQSFDTEQQFCRQVKQSFERDLEAESLLIVQCDSGNENASLVACAQYCVLDQLQQLEDEKSGKTHIVFIIHLPRMVGGGFTGFQCGKWHSVHIDDLRPDDDKMPSFIEMKNKSVGTLLENAAGSMRPRDAEDMEWEDKAGQQEEVDEVEMEEDQDVYPHDFGNMMEHNGQVHVQKKVDIPFFIKLTAHPALGMVKDPDGDSARTTERVKILLELLHQETKEKLTFMNGVGRHLAALMKEKEETMGQSAEGWLYAEATNRDCINRAGTFRKARNQCIIEKLSPILAGIIAEVDTNSNLDLLIQTDPNSWIHRLWLEIINDPYATGIEYSMIVSPKKQQELPEVVVKGTGCDGVKFRARMPFSWLIYKLIDRIMRTSQDVDKHEEIQELVVRVTNIIENISLGKVLQRCLSEVKVTECIEAYLSDFVHMVYHVTSVEEHQMVCQNLLNGMNMDFREGLRSVVQNFVAIHAVYNKSIPRLRNFASITRVWHECSAKIIEFQRKSAQFYLVTDEELTLDILGLHLLLKSLEPAKDSLNDQRGRQHWQKQVHKYRPVVERILGQFVQEADPSGVEEFGRRCIEGIKAARCQWTRVIAMKLFLQHVCADDVQPVERCMTLWVMLKDDVDFKDIESLKKVEQFLKIIMKKAVTNAFGRTENCKACESEITERPIQLPCKDVICIKCYNDMKILGGGEREECPVCHDEIPDRFDPQQDNTQNIKIQKLRMFKRRCNSFFMDLVSQLCFSDDVPPSRHVVEKLMSYITATARSGRGGRMASKEMSVFEEGIDPTPVLRSFLLQHLLRTSSEEVRRCLEMYLEKVEELMSLKENEEKMVELCLLVIQCLEDSFHQEVTKNADSEKYKIKMATQLLQQNVMLVMREGVDVEKLHSLAETRFALIVVAEVLHKLMVEKSIKATQNIRRLLEAAGKLCDECGSKQPKLFLIKHLCRCFGLETYQKICKTGDVSMVRWLSVPDLQKNEIVECSDRFIVCGDQYKTVREKLTQAVLGQNMDTLSTAVEDVKVPDFQKRTLVLLAVLREITLSYLYPENRRRVTPAAVELLHQFLAQHPMFANQVDLPRALCTNSLWRRNPQLTVHEGMDLGHQNTLCVLNHFFIVLLQIPDDRTLIEPLNKLVQQPQDMQRAFLPTMPQDDVAEIKEALLAARRGGDENPVFYRCPNGHPYIIGNCGRPYYRGHCKECGAEIGGEGHKLLPTNQLHDGLDQTATGHILGRAEGRQPVGSPERSLSPIECAVTRLFTHMAMYLGASINLQAIKNMIKPDLEDHSVLPFLWAHIEKDLTTIQRAIGRSVDDVYVLLHKICNDIMVKHRNIQVNQDVCVLDNKHSRRKWEEDFAKSYLSPVFQDMDSYLKTLNKQLANDKRLGSDPLLCLLFEIDVPSEESSPSALHNVPAVWRYRSQITMDHLLHTVQVQGQTHQVLHMFLQEEHQLRAIRLVPGILKLQRLLIQRFQRKLDRAEATAVTIEDMIQGYENEGKAEEMRSLVADFSEAWQCVRQHLLTFTFPTLEGLTKIPKEYCQRPITEDQPVSVLLPTFRDAGLCSYGLLYYLLKKQNNFLQEYCKKKKTQYTQLPKVRLTDVTNAHLISYHPDRDILPMVMANCHYTFEVGKGTKIDYSFGDLERQLMDRFLFSKSVIEMPVYEFEMMTYRSETTNAVVFMDLRQKIKQEPLTPAVANQISEEIRAYPDLCETLDKLDITISFLKSVGGESNLSLEKFMTQTLKMENPFPSQKAKSSCVCKHAQSLWITLAMEKTKRQASHKEDAFEGLAGDYRVELRPEQRELIPAFCEDILLEKLRLLLEMLFECIMLTITVPRGTDDDDIDMTKVGLRDTLIGYISARQYDLDLNYPGWMSELVERIPNEGENFTKILNSQAVDVWLCLYAIYTQKESERR